MNIKLYSRMNPWIQPALIIWLVFCMSSDAMSANTLFVGIVVLTLIAIFIYVLGVVDVEPYPWTSDDQFIDYIAIATPATTLFTALNKLGVSPVEVRSLYLHTFSLSNHFAFGEVLDACKQINHNNGEVHIIGQGNKTSAKHLKAKVAQALGHSKNIRVDPVAEPLVQHYNLIQTNHAMYLWYEPNHEIMDGIEQPRDGAYLVEIHDTELAKHTFEGPLKTTP